MHHLAHNSSGKQTAWVIAAAILLGSATYLDYRAATNPAATDTPMQIADNFAGSNASGSRGDR